MTLEELDQKFRQAGLHPKLSRIKLVSTNFLPSTAFLDGNDLHLAGNLPDLLLVGESVTAVAAEVERRFSDENWQTWDSILVFVNPSQILAIEEKLTDEFSNFEDVVSSLTDPIVRLIAIHCFNALTTNGFSYAEIKGSKLSGWPATEKLATGQNPYSLLPLLGAYCPLALYRLFSLGIRALVMDGLKAITHSSVRNEYSSFLIKLFNDASV